MRLPDFEAWAVFAAVVDQRSFSGAANALGVSKATVSKAVTRLEGRLNTTLFHRTSRKLTLTESGRGLAEHAQRILSEGEAAEEAARDAATAPAGRVRVAAPVTFGVRHVAPAIADFLVLHPAVQIDLCLSDSTVDIVAEGIDVALRIADLPDSSLRARRLTSIDVQIVGAPAYFEKHGRPQHPSELSQHACFAYTNVPQADLWRLRRGNEELAVRIQGPLSSDSGDAMLPALRAGLGIAFLPDFMVADDLRKGRLEQVLHGWGFPTVALHLVTPPGMLRPARVEALIAMLTERFRNLCVACE